MEFTPQGYLTLSNSHALLIQINDTTEEVYYRYSDEDSVATTSEIGCDEEGEPWFKVENGTLYYLSEFMKIV
jgi:hypothetical protein